MVSRWFTKARAHSFVVAAALAMGCAIAAAPARAQNCQSSYSSINFGTIDPTTGLAIDGTGTLQVQCQGNANATARVCPNLNSGSGGDAGSPALRLMTNGANSLKYSIYTDASRSTLWGSYLWSYSGTAPSPTLDIPLGPTGQATVSYPVYARIAGGQQTAPAGAYQTRFNGQQDLLSVGYTTSGTCAIISGTGGRRENFTLDANVQATCSVGTTAVAFGSKALLTTITDATGQVRITCTLNTAYTVGLDGGTSGSASPTARRMTQGASFITYGLYGDAARTQPWFNTNAFFQATGTGSGLAQPYTVYGRVPVQTTPPTGTYADNVVVTVTY